MTSRLPPKLVRRWSLSLFWRCSAVDFTDLLAITDPFFIFHWFCLVFLHTWFQSHQLHVVFLTLCFPSCSGRRLFVCMFVYMYWCATGSCTHFYLCGILVLEFLLSLLNDSIYTKFDSPAPDFPATNTHIVTHVIF